MFARSHVALAAFSRRSRGPGSRPGLRPGLGRPVANRQGHARSSGILGAGGGGMLRFVEGLEVLMGGTTCQQPSSDSRLDSEQRRSYSSALRDAFAVRAAQQPCGDSTWNVASEQGREVTGR